MRRSEEFKTRAEARAFAQGVEFANDSALSVTSIYRRKKDKKWIVAMEDEDYDE
jgi:hypothetical protein